MTIETTSSEWTVEDRAALDELLAYAGNVNTCEGQGHNQLAGYTYRLLQAFAAAEKRGASLQRERDEWKAVAAQGRAAGRAEAAALLMEQSAEEWATCDKAEELTEAESLGDSGDYSWSWNAAKVRELFDVAEDGGATASLLERLDGAYWQICAENSEQIYRHEREMDEALSWLRSCGEVIAVAEARAATAEGEAKALRDALTALVRQHDDYKTRTASAGRKAWILARAALSAAPSAPQEQCGTDLGPGLGQCRLPVGHLGAHVHHVTGVCPCGVCAAPSATQVECHVCGDPLPCGHVPAPQEPTASAGEAPTAAEARCSYKHDGAYRCTLADGHPGSHRLPNGEWVRKPAAEAQCGVQHRDGVFACTLPPHSNAMHRSEGGGVAVTWFDPEVLPSAEAQACSRCEGCGRIADSDDGEPWTEWESLPPGADLAVRAGIVKPIPCPTCSSQSSPDVPRG